MIAGFNLFEVMGIVRQEERHSDFLAFLLDPTQPHGLADAVLRDVLHAALSNGGVDAPSVSSLEAALLELSDARVLREWNCVDLLVVSDDEKIVIALENKVDSDEHDDQLERYLELTQRHYAGYRIVPVFLTPDGRPSSHARYHRLGYRDVMRVLRGTLATGRQTMGGDVVVAVTHYVEMLERHIVDDSEIAKLAKRIYQRHRRALDLIFEYRPDDQQVVLDAVRAAIQGESTLRGIYVTKSVVHFVPTAWDGLPPLDQGDPKEWYGGSTNLLRFEMELTGHLSVHLRIGPGPAEHRQRLYDMTALDGHLFSSAQGRSNTLYDKWVQVWRSIVIAKGKDWNSLTVEERVAKFETWWKGFVSDKLPSLTAFFVSRLAEPPAVGVPADGVTVATPQP